MAFRLRRPYATEDEFLSGDGAAISRSGMVLVGAGVRPVGLIVRFEIALRDGNALFRGEGKVVGHRATDEGGKPPGLEIRFTRLDARGKGLVDRVLREREVQVPDLVNPGSIPPLSMPMSMPAASIPELSVPVVDTDSTQIAPPVELALPPVVEAPVAQVPPVALADDESPATDRSGAPPAVASGSWPAPPPDDATVMIVVPTGAPEGLAAGPAEGLAAGATKGPVAGAPEGASDRDQQLEKLRRRGAPPVAAPPGREALLGRLKARV